MSASPNTVCGARSSLAASPRVRPAKFIPFATFERPAHRNSLLPAICVSNPADESIP